MLLFSFFLFFLAFSCFLVMVEINCFTACSHLVDIRTHTPTSATCNRQFSLPSPHFHTHHTSTPSNVRRHTPGFYRSSEAPAPLPQSLSPPQTNIHRPQTLSAPHIHTSTLESTPSYLAPLGAQRHQLPCPNLRRLLHQPLRPPSFKREAANCQHPLRPLPHLCDGVGDGRDLIRTRGMWGRGWKEGSVRTTTTTTRWEGKKEWPFAFTLTLRRSSLPLSEWCMLTLNVFPC